MLEILDSLRGITLFSVAARLSLAVLCGGLIGLERELKRRAAGFRTHILICLGAAITTLTSEFLLLYMHYSLDVTRMGAAVAAGMGFIGAGSIVVTRHQRVKGLTTAAGLWTAAIVGLAIGAGFYEGALITTVLILLAEFIFTIVERRLLYKHAEVLVFVEYHGRECLERIVASIRSRDIKIIGMEVSPSKVEGVPSNVILDLYLRKHDPAEFLAMLREIEHVTMVEEL